MATAKAKASNADLSAEEVARRLNRSLTTVYRLVAEKELPNAKRFGRGKGVLMIPEADVRAYQARQLRPAV